MTIPNSVTSIGESAFSCCSGLSSVTLSDKLETIGVRAFEQCPITSVTIPNSVKTIGERAFSCCPLSSVVIPESVINIDDEVFFNCSYLSSVSIPNSVKNIGANVFYHCPLLTKTIVVNDVLVRVSPETDGYYSIPRNITKIAGGAFEGCNKITSLNIPDYVTSIDGYSFYGSYYSEGYFLYNLITLNYNSTAQAYNIKCKELNIGDNISIIYNNFNYSTLNKVTLGKNVAYIRTESFSNANLQEFTITSDNPPYCYPNIFGSKDLSNATLYVPKGQTDYYQTTEPWTSFGKVLTLEGDEPITPTPCETPTIAYTGNKISFGCTTEGASIHYTISPADNLSGITTAGDVEISGIYNITAYATAEGKTQSETTSQQIKCAAGTVEIPIEVHDTIYVYDDTHSNIKLPTGETIKLNVTGGAINIENAPTNALVSVYTIDGELYEAIRVKDNITSFTLPRNSIYIIKVGGKTIKIKI